MKTIEKYIAIISIIICISIPVTLLGQTEPPPPPGEHGETGDQAAGGGAPIGSGLFVLLSLGIVYGGRRTYQLLKANKS